MSLFVYLVSSSNLIGRLSSPPLLGETKTPKKTTHYNNSPDLSSERVRSVVVQRAFMI
jgi:hypothetical protein